MIGVLRGIERRQLIAHRQFIAVEIDSAPGNPHGHPKKAHSVLTEHLIDEEGTPTRAALDQTLTFFREKLGVGAGPGPRPDGLGS